MLCVLTIGFRAEIEKSILWIPSLIWSYISGLLTICSNGSALLNKMAALTMVKKHLKIFFTRIFEAESWYIAYWGTQGLQNLFKCLYPRMTFDLFYVKFVFYSCSGNTGRMLHDIYRYAMAVKFCP